MSRATTQELREVFARYDRHSKGFLTRREYKLACIELLGRTLPSPAAPVSCEQLSSALAAELSALRPDDLAQQRFRALDSAGRGFLAAGSAAAAQGAFAALDGDKDGRVTYGDYARATAGAPRAPEPPGGR
eukprot:m51a1_g11513 hypothetical protein (131) ;mRNA; r:13379-13917